MRNVMLRWPFLLLFYLSLACRYLCPTLPCLRYISFLCLSRSGKTRDAARQGCFVCNELMWCFFYWFLCRLATFLANSRKLSKLTRCLRPLKLRLWPFARDCRYVSVHVREGEKDTDVWRERHRYLTRKTHINFVHVFCKDNLHLLTPPPHVDKSIYHVASTMFSVKIKCMKSTVYNSPLLTHVDEHKYRVLEATVSPLHRSRFSSASSQLSCRCLYWNCWC